MKAFFSFFKRWSCIAIENGQCPICGTRADFLAKKGESLREARCSNCAASKRNRDVASALLKTCVGNGNLSLRENSSELKNFSIYQAESKGPIRQYLKHLPHYISSEYPAHFSPASMMENGTRFEDLQNLSFSDNLLDLVITQDVFEHVADPKKAFLEIRRVLKRGGHHIFTVPFHEGRRTMVRAVLDEKGKIRNLLPPVHHFDSNGKETLVFSDFGENLLSDLMMLGLPTEILIHNKFYSPSEIPAVSDEITFRQYQRHKSKNSLLKFFLYNSVVFRSRAVK